MKSFTKFGFLFLFLVVIIACGYPDNTQQGPSQNENNPTPVKETSTPAVKITPPTTTPTQEMAELIGDWSGSAQWMCDNNPVWQVQMSFSSDGKVSAILTSEAGSTDTVNVNWFLSDETITIKFPANDWTGIVEENEISGTFNEENCSGIWIIHK